jgi:hypothetical protein
MLALQKVLEKKKKKKKVLDFGTALILDFWVSDAQTVYHFQSFRTQKLIEFKAHRSQVKRRTGSFSQRFCDPVISAKTELIF